MFLLVRFSLAIALVAVSCGRLSSAQSSSQCSSYCQTVEEATSSCANSGSSLSDYDDCLCSTSGFSSAVKSCYQCLQKVDSSFASTFQQYVDVCESIGGSSDSSSGSGSSAGSSGSSANFGDSGSAFSSNGVTATTSHRMSTTGFSSSATTLRSGDDTLSGSSNSNSQSSAPRNGDAPSGDGSGGKSAATKVVGQGELRNMLSAGLCFWAVGIVMTFA